MRIIAGDCRGRKLTAFRGAATRPTADRVREAIFNILSDAVIGAQVLDLFAGTGALGLEALSRGARAAVFLDASLAAVRVIEKNIAICRMESRARAIRWDIRRGLNRTLMEAAPFDLAFMDPPYRENLICPALSRIIGNNLLRAGGLIVAEHGADDSLPADLAGCVLTDRRAYGKTLVSFLKTL